MTKRVEIIAHRGASHDAPENTLAAVRLAWDQGADAVEADFRLTADGHVVAMHDASTARTTGVELSVGRATLADLRRLDAGRWKGARWAGEPVPTLAEMLATVPPGRRFFAEIKCGEEIVPALSVVLRESVVSLRQIAVISYDLAVLMGIKSLLPAIRVYLVASFEQDEAGRWTPDPHELIDRAQAAGLDGLDLMAGGPIDAALVRAAKQAALALCVWTVDELPLARDLIAAGVDAVTTNRPGWLRESLFPDRGR